MDLYIDCEWQIPNKLFLIGYCYSQTTFNQLYDNTLTISNVVNMLMPVDGFIFIYGPDIAIIENYFGIDIRHTKRCINLIKVFRHYEPYFSSYKLKALEWYYNVDRKSEAYKENIFTFLHDWYKPEMRKQCLLYNKEDVINLMKVKKMFFSDHEISKNDLDDMLLK
jgi:hypothetical protein